MSKLTKPSLSAFDRFTLSLAPEWTLRRLQARAAADALARGYNAATVGHRTSGWRKNRGDANAVLAVASLELRTQARDLIRNNSWAKRGQRIIANNTAGWGIVPKATGLDEKLNAEAMRRWKLWADTTQCESEGRHTFYGLQQAVMKAIASDGEVLLRRRWRLDGDGLEIPMQLQLLEIDFLDTAKDGERGVAGGNIVQGVEYDLLGRRAAYWLFPEHPGSSGVSGNNLSRRIKAEDIAHIFYSDRPGQTRGVSWFGTAIVNLKDFDEWEDAELMRQKIAACFAAFVTDIDGAGNALGTEDEDDESIDTLEPGLIKNLRPGQDVKFASPPSTVNESFTIRQLRRVAAGLGVTYEDLTGDYSQVNFSSARMSRISHQSNVRDWQYNILIPQLCASVWAWAMEAAFPILPKGAQRPGADWTVPPLPMIEPDKEGLAYQRLVRVGAMTPSAMVREQGGDPAAHWAEYAADMATLDALEIQLDSDVRAVSQAGLTQARVGLTQARVGLDTGGSDAPKTDTPKDEPSRTLEVAVARDLPPADLDIVVTPEDLKAIGL